MNHANQPNYAPLWRGLAAMFLLILGLTLTPASQAAGAAGFQFPRTSITASDQSPSNAPMQTCGYPMGQLRRSRKRIIFFTLAAHLPMWGQ